MPDVPSVDQMAREVYLAFANEPHALQHVAEHPVCEICGKAPSVRITRWGTIQAACQACLNDEVARFEQACREQEDARARLDALEAGGCWYNGHRGYDNGRR